MNRIQQYIHAHRDTSCFISFYFFCGWLCGYKSFASLFAWGIVGGMYAGVLLILKWFITPYEELARDRMREFAREIGGEMRR